MRRRAGGGCVHPLVPLDQPPVNAAQNDAIDGVRGDHPGEGSETGLHEEDAHRTSSGQPHQRRHGQSHDDEGTDGEQNALGLRRIRRQPRAQHSERRSEDEGPDEEVSDPADRHKIGRLKHDRKQPGETGRPRPEIQIGGFERRYCDGRGQAGDHPLLYA